MQIWQQNVSDPAVCGIPLILFFSVCLLTKEFSACLYCGKHRLLVQFGIAVFFIYLYVCLFLQTLQLFRLTY